MADCRCRFGRLEGRPPIEHDRLSGREIAENMYRNAAIRRSQVLSIAKVMGMGAQPFDRWLISVRDLDLWQDGIGFKIYADGYPHVLFA